MRLIIQKNYEEACRWAANHMAERIRGFAPTKDRPLVLGLPTGSSPLGIYRELINMYKAGKISFADIISFNMDEYVGLAGDHPQSYRYFMQDNFFNHIDIKVENTHILNGRARDLTAECRAYEEAIKTHGGIELFLGGMGSDGHIAFNEPGSSIHSRTRIKTLTAETRAANARFFDGDIGQVPGTALTVGIGTVMDAREVLIIVSGRSKARALQAVIEGGVSHWWPLSCLQMHPRAIIVCDEEATDELKVGTVRYFKDVEK
ncbi:glucosamine-6-phosphate deaminase [Spirochaetia bacterium]|nr:glucosamine-6-phosphate deaminase [Spirochaetia bacterium]